MEFGLNEHLTCITLLGWEPIRSIVGMTAEIVVANKWGIALAADSAVTTTQVHKGEVREKVFHAANKVFTLSKWEPVGIMMYNTVTIGGTPWETVIKLARGKLGKDSHPLLSGYVNFFFDTLKNNKYFFPEENVREIVYINVFRILYELSMGDLNREKFKEKVEKRILSLEKLDGIEGFDDEFMKSAIREYAEEINKAIEGALRSALRRGMRRLILRLVNLSFSKKARLKGYSGLVFCGYGTEEVMPRVISYYSDIILCGRVRHWKESENKVGPETKSLVLPFADTRVIETLLQGINPDFKQKQLKEAIDAITRISEKVINQISEINGEKKKEYIDAAGKSIVESFIEFYRQMENYMKEEHTRPIERTIESLPLSDLAVVAETLLNASQIHKRVNPDTETVGGPVDVAVLSRGDGFVWIKRKHYFDLKLNPSFTNKYLDT